MTDYNLCASTKCKAKLDCKRNEACVAHYKRSDIQVYVDFQPEADFACTGFVSQFSEG